MRKTADDHDTEDAARRRVAALPLWSGPVDVERLGGGLSNRNYRVVDRRGVFVVRVGGDRPEHGIRRADEARASRAAHAAGIAPAVIHAEPGLLVLAWIEGRTLTPETARDPALRPRLVELLQRCHGTVGRHLEGPPPFFWVFHAIRDYARRLAGCGARHARDAPHFIAAADRLERAAAPFAIAFGHNDLLPANIIDDGRRLWLVDWEYAGYNDPLFDLNGLAGNCGFDAAERATLIEAYYGRRDDALMRRAAAFLAAALLREALWGLVSERHAVVDVDFAAYADDYLARFATAMAAFDGG